MGIQSLLNNAAITPTYIHIPQLRELFLPLMQMHDQQLSMGPHHPIQLYRLCQHEQLLKSLKFVRQGYQYSYPKTF